MTRARAKRVREALQGLIMELQEQEVGQHNANTSPKLVNLTHLSWDDAKDNKFGPTLVFLAGREERPATGR